jgi:hypothetical protein
MRFYITEKLGLILVSACLDPATASAPLRHRGEEAAILRLPDRGLKRWANEWQPAVAAGGFAQMHQKSEPLV